MFKKIVYQIQTCCIYLSFRKGTCDRCNKSLLKANGHRHHIHTKHFGKFPTQSTIDRHTKKERQIEQEETIKNR